jgi:copper chaperone CopZ
MEIKNTFIKFLLLLFFAFFASNCSVITVKKALRNIDGVYVSETTSVEITIENSQNNINVSAVDKGDGEVLEVSGTKYTENFLAFFLRTPSTSHQVKMRFDVSGSGTLEKGQILGNEKPVSVSFRKK